MHNHYPPPRIRTPFQLIPPGSGSDGEGPQGDAARCDEQRGTARRILLVEDEFLLSTVLIADLQAAGYEVVGPCSTLSAATLAVQSQSFDGAILDINLRGEMVDPVAEELARRHIPFVFLSAYALVNMPDGFRPTLA